MRSIFEPLRGIFEAYSRHIGLLRGIFEPNAKHIRSIFEPLRGIFELLRGIFEPSARHIGAPGSILATHSFPFIDSWAGKKATERLSVAFWSEMK